MSIIRVLLAAVLGAAFSLAVGCFGCLVLGFLAYFVFDAIQGTWLLSYMLVGLPVAGTLAGGWFCIRAVFKDSKHTEKQTPPDEIRDQPDWLKHRMTNCKPDE